MERGKEAEKVRGKEGERERKTRRGAEEIPHIL